MGDSIDFAALQQLAADAGQGYVDAPRGTWEMEISKAEAARTSEATGKKVMFKLVWKVVSGPHQGATHPHNLVVSPESPGAIGIYLRHMNALGLGPDYQATKPDNDQVARDMKGRRAMVTIADDRRDATRTAVTNIAAVSGATPVVRDAGTDAADPFAVFKPVSAEQQAAATSDGAAPPEMPF